MPGGSPCNVYSPLASVSVDTSFRSASAAATQMSFSGWVAPAGPVTVPVMIPPPASSASTFDRVEPVVTESASAAARVDLSS